MPRVRPSTSMVTRTMTCRLATPVTRLGVLTTYYNDDGARLFALQLGRCDASCPCPPGITTDTLIPALQMFLKHGFYLEAPGGTLLRGPGLGLWERLGHHQFEACFKCFLFNPDFSRRGSDEVTSHIHLTGPDAFEATARRATARAWRPARRFG